MILVHESIVKVHVTREGVVLLVPGRIDLEKLAVYLNHVPGMSLIDSKPEHD